MFSLRAAAVRSARHRLLAVSSRARTFGFGLRKPGRDAQTEPAEDSLLGRITELARADAKAVKAPRLKLVDSLDTFRRPAEEHEDLKSMATSAALDLRNLTFDTTDDDLRQHFAPYGTLKIVRLIMDQKGRGRGGAYIAFETVAQAQAALDAHFDLKGVRELPQLHGRILFVRPASRDPAKKACLYVKRLPTHVSIWEVKAFFIERGFTPTAVRVATRPGRGVSLAYAHVDFRSKEDAEAARRGLDGVKFPGVKAKRPIRVAFAEQDVAQPIGLPPTNTLFVSNIGPSNASTGREIDEFFEEFEPVKVRLRTQKGAREVDVPMPRDRDARHRWTYALVQFRTVDDAQRAMDACRERQLPDGRYPRIEFTQPRDDPDEDERHLEPWT